MAPSFIVEDARPGKQKRAPKGGITFTEPFTIVFFQQDCSIRLLTSGDCPAAPSRSSNDDQWLPLRESGFPSSYSGGTVTDLHRVPFIELSLCFLGQH